METNQMDMLSSTKPPEQSNLLKTEENVPLAFAMRPSHLEDYCGGEELLKRHPFLGAKVPPSLIFHGPPGCGKSTLAYILAHDSGLELYPFNAVLAGVAELRKLIARAIEVSERQGQKCIIFIDEIHRFNKAQQDALLPHVEKGDFILFGATTENPNVSINNALLSRVQRVRLERLSRNQVLDLLKRAADRIELSLEDEVLNIISRYSGGDARCALNTLEILKERPDLTLNEVENIVKENAKSFDRDGNQHYDVISAFIKSMRGTDPDAALVYLALMLERGEDPLFIARRMVIFASEDVGNADPMALSIANAALMAVKNIGMPECRINLAQAVTYLASTIKSNRSYLAFNQAQAFVKENPNLEVPNHLKNHPAPSGQKYLYPHDFPEGFVKQNYLMKKSPVFYRPHNKGREGVLKSHLQQCWKSERDY